MADHNPFSDFLNLLIPAIGSGIKQANIGTEPIREYFSPVLGLGEPGEFKRLVDNLGTAVRGAVPELPKLPQNFTPRKAVLGELRDLQLANFLERQKRTANALVNPYQQTPQVMTDLLRQITDIGGATTKPAPSRNFQVFRQLP